MMSSLVILKPTWSRLVETRFALPAKPHAFGQRHFVRRRSDAALLTVDELRRAVAPFVAVVIAAFHFSPLARIAAARILQA